jgi:hypothetical protein
MKEIQILEEQIDKIDRKEFDFKAWKQSTILILARMFGNEDQKVKQINMLELDYSSWSLRDTSGKSSQIESLKKLGKEILYAAIGELNSKGLPETDPTKHEFQISKVIVLALENELKISQLRELISIINSNTDPEVKKSGILKKLKTLDHQTTTNILASILSNNTIYCKL